MNKFDLTRFDWCVVVAAIIAAVVFAALGDWWWCLEFFLFAAVFGLLSLVLNRLIAHRDARRRSQS